MFVRLLMLIGLCALGSVQASSPEHDITIVYAADLPIIDAPNHGDYAELATLLGQQRTQTEHPVSFIFGGASLAPSPLASFDSGSHIVDILNLLNPDVMNITKREFSYFEDELILRSYEAAFPFLLSNVTDRYTNQPLDGIYQEVLIETTNVTLGVISVVAPNIKDEYLLERAIIHDPETSLRTHASNIREQGADIVILLHSDDLEFIPATIEEGLIDFSIQSKLNNARQGIEQSKRHKNQIVIEELGVAAIIEVKRPSTESVVEVDKIEIRLDTLTPDAEVSDLIKRYQRRLDSQLNRKIASVGAAFETSRTTVRTSESAFGNLLTDAIKDESKADAALINGGIIRGEHEYAAGDDFTRRDLLLELPFRTRLVVLRVSGQMIVDALENGVSQLEKLKGRFPQVSGLQYEVNSSAPVGQRISNVLIGEAPLREEKSYVLATSDYLFNGGDGYTMFSKAERLYENAPTTPLLSDVLERKISTTGVVNPTTQGRIIVK